MFLVWLKATITLAGHCRLFRLWTPSTWCWSCEASEDQRLDELLQEGTQATSPAPLSSASTVRSLPHSPPHEASIDSFLFLFFFCQCHSACGILVAWPGIEPMSPAVEARSPNQWAAREYPAFPFLKDIQPINQIPYDYTVEVTNTFKGLDLIDSVPEELRTEVRDIVQEAVIKTILKKKKCKKAKWLFEETL